LMKTQHVLTPLETIKKNEFNTTILNSSNVLTEIKQI
jgi:hypothetical protein